MSVTVAITQPTFLPWAGFFDLVARADVFVLLDTVQFERQSWQSRNRIQSKSGVLNWLSIPLQKAPLNTPLNVVKVAEQPTTWRRKQRQSITESLQHGQYFDTLIPALDTVYLQPHERLARLNEAFIRAVSTSLELDTRIIRASELPVNGKRVDLLLDICRHAGAQRYYANAGSAVYLEAAREQFDSIGVQLEYQQWVHPTYSQFTGGDFVSHLSVIDAIAHLGYDSLANYYHGT